MADAWCSYLGGEALAVAAPGRVEIDEEEVDGAQRRLKVALVQLYHPPVARELLPGSSHRDDERREEEEDEVEERKRPQWGKGPRRHRGGVVDSISAARRRK